MAGLIGDNRGQIIIILTLFISVLLAELSLVYTQNVLAGMESSTTQLTFPKYAIENLRRIAFIDLKKYAENNPNNFLNYAQKVNQQVEKLYAEHGCYASINIVDVKYTSNDEISCYTVNIVFFNSGVDYEDTETVVV
ncbi:MAG: hypothetical protein DSY33_02635 [Archaeoglobus sp.]|jgi:hypothetical protein|nr:MAG: hypothetical protein DSY33_02635 [Archaeoglobus sp.]